MVVKNKKLTKNVTKITRIYRTGNSFVGTVKNNVEKYFKKIVVNIKYMNYNLLLS